MSQLLRALAPYWVIALHTDYIGEISIVIFSTTDNPTSHTFVYFEKDGLAHIATICGDDWLSVRSLTTSEQAVAALIAEVAGPTDLRASGLKDAWTTGLEAGHA